MPYFIVLLPLTHALFSFAFTIRKTKIMKLLFICLLMTESVAPVFAMPTNSAKAATIQHSGRFLYQSETAGSTAISIALVDEAKTTAATMPWAFYDSTQAMCSIDDAADAVHACCDSITQPDSSTQRLPGSGIQLIWAPDWADTIPYVQSIQGVYTWKKVEPEKGNYNFSLLHSDLKRAAQLKKPIMLQLNMPCPDWVADYVSILGTSRGGYAPQYWDTTYIKMQIAVLQQFAAEIKKDKNNNWVIGVRVQVNGYNTEYFAYDPAEFKGGALPDENDRSTWASHPRGYSADNPKYAPNRTDIYPGTTDNYGQAYMRIINDVYIKEFQGIGIRTYWRTLMLGRFFPETYLDQLMRSPLSGVLDTRCGLNNTDGMPSRIKWFVKYALGWKKPAYWEDSQFQFEGHSWEQDMYWRSIIRLYAGVSYVAVYGQHINYTEGYSFVNKYAGYKNDPAHSPGAWIVFAGNRVKADNFDFLLKQTNIAETEALADVSKDYRGLWARSSRIGFNTTLDPSFYETIKGKPVTISVIWLDNGATFELPGVTGKLGGNSGTYQTASFTTTLTKNEINVKVLSGELILHMIEVER